MIRIIILVSVLLCNSFILNAQSPGVIYNPSTTVLGKNVMDPNGDGYVSINNQGLSSIDYSTGSEMKMIALPVMEGEPLGDIVTGGTGGHTDISNYTTTGQSTGITGPNSVFVLKRTVNGVAYLVFRFRLGGASTATKGYSVLMDIDGNFGTLWNGNNPGFDREIVMETGANGRIAIYKHENNNELTAIYPNPAKDYIEIITPWEENVIYRIISLNGGILHEGKLLSNKTFVSLKDLKTGIYLIEIQKKESKELLKLIKQ